MKPTTLFITMLLATGLISSRAQNTWTQKAYFGGTGSLGAVGFSIGSKGYLGTGSDGTTIYKKDFWEYDSVVNTWTQKADFGGTARYNAVGFSIGSKGYLGTGNDGSYKKDFWEYDPDANTWIQKADFGGTFRSSAVGFSISNKGYLGTGLGGAYNKDFWEYDPAANTWTKKADFGGTAREGAVGFGIGSKGYLGTGYNNGAFYKDFWEYDPDANTWTQKADFGGTTRWSAVGFSIGSKGYLGTGYDGSNFYKDFWEYDPALITWSLKEDFGGTPRFDAVGFSIGSKGYLGTGYIPGANYKDFWEYTPGESVPTCNIPTNLSTDNITSSTATLKWNAVSGAISYQVLYKTAGTSEWNLERTNSNEKTLTGLLPNTNYAWKVKSICSLSPFTLSEPSAPSKFTTAPLRLTSESKKQSSEVFPNPFSHSTTLSFSLSEEAHAVIELFDLAGRKLQTIIDENLSAGNHEVILNRGQLSTGIYLLQVKMNDQLEVRKLEVE